MPNGGQGRTAESEVERLRMRLAEAEQTLQAIRLQASQRATLISTTSDGYWRYDRQGQLLEVNDAYCQMSGYSRDELLHMHIADIETIETPEEVLRYIQRVADTGFDRFETRHRKKSGDIFDVEISASHFPASGQFLLFARDITRRKRAEEEVRELNRELERRVAARTEALRELNKELEAFNYAVAHDLRAPLRQIDGFVEILAEEASPLLSDSAKRHLQTIRDGVKNMEQLLEDLHSLSKLRRQQVSTQLCGFDSLVDEAIAALKPECQGRQVEWRIAKPLPFVDCDRILMKQVLVNLLSNALKFTRFRKPAIIEIGQAVVDGEFAILVRDNGVGFSMKYANKLFGLFQRLHRREDFEGTGVGLAIVQRIVHMHGGRVWAEAELERGATFYFSLPTCETLEKELANAHASV